MTKEHSENLKAKYRKAEREILLYTRGKRSAAYFLRHVLCFFRENLALCEVGEYKELYDETVALLLLRAYALSDWTKDSPKNQRELIELLADLEISSAHDKFEHFSIETVDEYLKYRKSAWALGQRYTMNLI